MTTRVSVVINNYNYEEFVRIAVDSALRQTYRDIEIIVVDDGSGDGSLEVLQGFGQAITIVSKENGGQGSAYNAGFRLASGDVVIFLDADDWLYPGAVAQIVKAWRNGVSKVQFRLNLVDRCGNSLGRHVPRRMFDTDALSLLQEFGEYGSPPGSGNAYAAAFLREVLPMNEWQWRTAADTVPIALAPAFGEVLSLPQALGAYRLHRRQEDDSLLMNNAPGNLWDEYERIENTKRYIGERLLRLNLRPQLPLRLAPWEARIAILCARFGGEPRWGIAGSKTRFVRWTLRSLWRWPHWTWQQKMVQTVWMLLVLVLPDDSAIALARKHKAGAGAPVQASNPSLT